MCLNIDKIAHGKKDINGQRNEARRFHHARVATRDIVVYKVLRNCGDVSGVSPYQSARWVWGKRVNVIFESEAVFDSYGYATVDVGLHAFYDLESARKRANRVYDGKMCWAIIPKGSKLFFGARGEIVSTSMIVYKTKRDMVKKHGPVGEPVRKYNIAK